MFERYTEQARRSVFFARYVAGHQRATCITTAHLLVGLAWEGKTRIAEIDLSKNRIPELCLLLGIPWPLGKASKKQLMTDLRLDKNAKMALMYAVEEANLDRHPSIDSDHLVRGLLRFPNEASHALQSIKLDLPTARAASQHSRVEFASEVNPISTPARSGSRQAPGMVGRPLLVVAVIALAEILLLFLASSLK